MENLRSIQHRLASTMTKRNKTFGAFGKQAVDPKEAWLVLHVVPHGDVGGENKQFIVHGEPLLGMCPVFDNEAAATQYAEVRGAQVFSVRFAMPHRRSAAKEQPVVSVMESMAMCKCAKNPSTEPHACPYAKDVNNNHDPEFCTCCAECEHQCRMEI